MTAMLTFTNVRMVDLDRGVLTEPKSVSVHDGKIVAAVSDQPGGEVIDLGGATLMPGFIDCHFHVVAWSLDLWANTIAPDSLAALRAARVMEGLLADGFTTVRDLGGADFGLVRGVNEGLIKGPDLVICGKGLSMTGGHTDLRQRTDSRPDTMGWRVGNMGVLVDGVDDVRRACRKMIKEGARFIKVMANGGVSSPNHHIARAKRLTQHIRGPADQVIPGGMAQAVIHRFQPVQVADQYCHRPGPPAREAGQFLIKK